ncbi:MucB/RseB C-terminal domain-containing protein [Gilvimarinus sp. DA14]|uniref:MucB/RseB C-terminal domain-containing protein n=1 Tax=Gilvimarinus sp. DA14 TaxID=2956798 RepID=UPI0020B8CC4B|nr:MucB/RseB C-terminal domain-containing protein [Gilvimarinus sp. DA14]UTF61425.1 MucB/RseB C-terminal domain-containing protein [Gilvimarinus sp. DA14]
MSRLAGALLLTLLPLSVVQAQSPSDEADPASSSSSSAISEDSTIRSVSELLAKVAQQQRHLNYQGIFTHQDTNGSDSFRLQHWVDDGVEYQRVYYLQGPEREAIINKPLGCQGAAEKLLLNRASSLQEQRSELEKLYSFRLLGVDRIAGREATILHIVPRDPFRFGYVFSIDRATGLVTKSILLDENQRPVEQFQFVELETEVPLESFVNASAPKISHRVRAADMTNCEGTAKAEPASWRLGWVPEGFAFAGERQVRNNIQMLMYTDGLSTFSVFLDPAAQEVAIEARARRGATNFYLGGVKSGQQLYQLTVVGEVPASVAERIGQALQPKS